MVTRTLSRRLEQLVTNPQLRQDVGARAQETAAGFSLADRSSALWEALDRAAADPQASPRIRKVA